MVKNTPHNSSKTLGKLFQIYLPAKTHRTYSCLHCRAQLASHDELISKVWKRNIIFFLYFFFFFQSFQGSQGRAYLFNSVYELFFVYSTYTFLFSFIFSSVNVNTSAAEERVLLTGLHEVADVYCDCCKTLLGWKYVRIYWFKGKKNICFFSSSKEHAFESSQKYKEGKYIIELVHMIKDNGWDDDNAEQAEYLKKWIKQKRFNWPACKQTVMLTVFE
jgi:hypothetical protein